MELAFIALAVLLLLTLLPAPRCPVCRGPHYGEPGEQHDPTCYMRRSSEG